MRKPKTKFREGEGLVRVTKNDSDGPGAGTGSSDAQPTVPTEPSSAISLTDPMIFLHWDTYSASNEFHVRKVCF